MFSRLFKIISLSLAILYCLPQISSATQLKNQVISDIQVEGSTTIAGDEIISWLDVKPGEKFEDVRLVLDRDLKNIWKTGKFEDVQFAQVPLSDGTIRLLITVNEKPIIEKVLFSGNQAFDEKKLTEKMELETGARYDLYTVNAAAAKIANFYKEKEYYQVDVQHNVTIQNNKAIVTFVIIEGMKVKITKISVIGHKAFSEGKIKGFMETKEAGWFVGGIYKEETFIEDMKKILLHYAKEGYLKAKIFGFGLNDIELNRQMIVKDALAVNEITKEMTIKLLVEEGLQYQVKDISVKGNIIYSSEELFSRMTLKSGAILDLITFEQDMHNVRMAYSEKGYIFADISPEMTYNDNAGTVVIDILVREGTIARVERVDIRGNTMTKDKVIRRELTVKPGEPFDSRKIQRSREKVSNLGFFQDVKVTTEPGSTPAEQVLVFDVAERHTGTISLGAGYSSVDYLMGYLQLTQANLFGNGQSVSLQWELGSLRQSWQMSFTEPWLFDSPVSFGVDVWNINKQKGYSGQDYNLLSQGGDIRLGRRFSERWKGYLTYKLESNEYTDLDSSLLGVYEEGRSDTSSVIPTLVYDTRDNIFDPTHGTYQKLSVECAGGFLGGDNNYFKYNLDSTLYIPLIWRVVLALHGEVGYARAFDYGISDVTNVPPAERYRVGGTDSVRGYGEGVFGSDLQGNGGRFKLNTNVELHFPIIGPLKGVAFFDAGNTWSGIDRSFDEEKFPDSANTSGEISYFSEYPSLYKGAGVGFRLTVPGTVILIRFDFGYPIDNNPDGKPPTLQYHFNIGNIF